MKKVLAIDVDDVLADSTVFWHGEVNRRTGAKLELDHWLVPGEYSRYYERVWEKHGIGHLISIDHIDEYMKQDQSQIKATPAATKVLKKLAERYELVIVTARNRNQEAATRKWLDKVYPGLVERIYFTRDPVSQAVRSKGEICAEIGASWLIDDFPGHCKDALANGVKPILYGQYGWHVDIPEGVVRCKKWQDIESYFDEQEA
ncbi:MAG: uncharacterized protein JWP13_450 [Candidatus Saccharibacteria bacterium]|nr:uncharacterized protein [Candidatus Saccharibacteria bacterium]